MSTENTIQPCRCGYDGALMGTVHGGFFGLQCPQCSGSVEALTLHGLADAWNAAQAPTGIDSEGGSHD